MLYSRSEILDRATRFAQRHACTFEKELGFGFDGIVFSTTCQSAIKAFRYEQLYRRERDVYHRLFDEGILAVRGFNVPRLICSDDELWIVEMTIVRPPFVLDFAGAYLDQRPDYPEEVMAEWRAEKAEQFEDNWPEVRRIGNLSRRREAGKYRVPIRQRPSSGPERQCSEQTPRPVCLGWVEVEPELWIIRRTAEQTQRGW